MCSHTVPSPMQVRKAMDRNGKCDAGEAAVEHEMQSWLLKSQRCSMKILL